MMAFGREKTHAGNVVLVANTLLQKTVPDFPGEDGRALALIVGDPVDDTGCRHSGLAPANRLRSDRAGFVVPAEDFADATVGHLQDARDVAWPCAGVSQLDDALSRGVRKGSPVDKHATELIDTGVTCG